MTLPSSISLLCICLYCAGSSNAKTEQNERNPNYWRELGLEMVRNTVRSQQMDKPARNVIFFLGDGMGISTVTAMRIYKGQKKGLRGEEEDLAFDTFPHVSLSKTYGLNVQNSDSANTATAYFCGVKANLGTLGVDGRVEKGDCEASTDPSTHLPSVLTWAQNAGMRTGFVTTTRVTHATPAGLYAHSAHRYWEASSPSEKCEDIASQLVSKSPGKNINVILGGGTSMFLPTSKKDVHGFPGNRTDSRDLINEWLQNKRHLKATAVFTYTNFTNVDPRKVDYMLGLFNPDHIPFVTERATAAVRTPSLVEMTEKAIAVLDKGPNGYFLMVEGGRIDSGHHDNSAIKALEDGVEFDAAVGRALQLTDPEETLIVVTADHSHPFTISGDYQKRGSNILGLGGLSDVDNMTISILNYANGPGYKSRANRTDSEVVASDYTQESIYPLKHDRHGAEDVAVYAKGPMAHLFHGVHDQSYIAHAVSCAANLCADCPSSSSINNRYSYSVSLGFVFLGYLASKTKFLFSI